MERTRRHTIPMLTACRLEMYLRKSFVPQRIRNYSPAFSFRCLQYFRNHELPWRKVANAMKKITCFHFLNSYVKFGPFIYQFFRKWSTHSLHWYQEVLQQHSERTDKHIQEHKASMIVSWVRIKPYLFTNPLFYFGSNMSIDKHFNTSVASRVEDYIKWPFELAATFVFFGLSRGFCDFQVEFTSAHLSLIFVKMWWKLSFTFGLLL